MKHDPVTGFEYPFYYVIAEVWNPKVEEYDGKVLAKMQTYDDALSLVKKTKVDCDTTQIEIIEEYYDSSDVVAIKVAVEDNPSGFDFYDPRTEKPIE